MPGHTEWKKAIWRIYICGLEGTTSFPSKREATEALKIQAKDLQELGVVDLVIGEPIGGAHADPEEAAVLIGKALRESLEELVGISSSDRLEKRYQKFRAMGRAGIQETPPVTDESDIEPTIS